MVKIAEYKATTTLLRITLRTVGRNALNRDQSKVKPSIGVEQLDSRSAITSHNYFTVKCQQTHSDCSHAGRMTPRSSPVFVKKTIKSLEDYSLLSNSWSTAL